MITTLFGFISLLLTAYSFIIFIRIIFSWFNLRNNNNGQSQNQIIQILHKITDPYLNWFRRFKFLQIGMIDFSAMLAISVLYFISNIFNQIGISGVISLAFIIKLIISTLWSLISSISMIIIILFIVRIVFLHINKYSQILQTLDGYVEPYARRFSNYFTKRFTSYKVNLLILTGAIFIARFVINYLLAFLFSLF